MAEQNWHQIMSSHVTRIWSKAVPVFSVLLGPSAQPIAGWGSALLVTVDWPRSGDTCPSWASDPFPRELGIRELGRCLPDQSCMMPTWSVERTEGHHGHHGGEAERGWGEQQARQGAEVLSSCPSHSFADMKLGRQGAATLVAFGACTAHGQKWTLGSGRPLASPGSGGGLARGRHSWSREQSPGELGSFLTDTKVGCAGWVGPRMTLGFWLHQLRQMALPLRIKNILEGKGSYVPILLSALFSPGMGLPLVFSLLLSPLAYAS